jgi:hypothetical protein
MRFRNGDTLHPWQMDEMFGRGWRGDPNEDWIGWENLQKVAPRHMRKLGPTDSVTAEWLNSR